ncbi:substrate-binding periplasmic protein [Planctobacterium marinum]|uniref:Solute-binding protein family 3/N-terminal domain-containing protein n=1 Tax=Planctobacterium marinum TaxID=1631968 RepID=A0AA48HMB7_9ALTE|nr:hypothetical protein MACH26_33900 [Planctobacterium marinum]
MEAIVAYFSGLNNSHVKAGIQRLNCSESGDNNAFFSFLNRLQRFLFIACLMPMLSQGAQECTKIVISGNPDYPPITWIDSHGATPMRGVAIELLEMAFSELSIPLDAMHVGNWKRAQHSARTGKIDLLAGPYQTTERNEYLEYVEPAFMQDPVAIFFKNGHQIDIDDWSQLRAYTGARPLGHQFGEQFDSFAQQNLKFYSASSIQQLFEMLVNERVDYVIYGLNPGLAEAAKGGFSNEITYSSNFISSEPMYLPFTISSPCRQYSDFLSKKIATFIETGVVEELTTKYLKMLEKQISVSD